MIGTFPFGQQVHKVVQSDRTPKRVFILGVYASAVHARWVSSSNRTVVNALAVASEPYIFWRGEGANEIIEAISIPEEIGRLEPAAANLNGPSGQALDKLYLAPMGLSRDDAWLCDLVPYSCVNDGQKKAIQREYLPLVQRYNLPIPSVPPRPKRFDSILRRSEIMEEIRESHAEILVLLGDEPIKWFLHPWENQWQDLSAFGDNSEKYGLLHEINIDGIPLQVLPLVHPRQAGKLGSFSTKWHALHQNWLNSNRCSVFK